MSFVKWEEWLKLLLQPSWHLLVPCYLRGWLVISQEHNILLDIRIENENDNENDNEDDNEDDNENNG